MSKIKRLEGKRFGILTVLRRAGTVKYGAAWYVRCDCGREQIVAGRYLRNGHKKSCGVGHSFKLPIYEVARRELKTWRNMINRCYDKNAASYKYYGAKDVRVCKRWRDSFQLFLADMGPAPSAKHSLDRYPDPEGDYEPINCRWATAKEQARNKRNTIFVVHDGQRVKLIELLESLGINIRLVRRRIQRGWDVGEAISVGVWLKDSGDARFHKKKDFS